MYIYILFICLFGTTGQARICSGRNVSANHQSHSPAFSAKLQPSDVCISLPECRWSKREPWSTDGLRDQKKWLGLGKMSWDVMDTHTHIYKYIYTYGNIDCFHIVFIYGQHFSCLKDYAKGKKH